MEPFPVEETGQSPDFVKLIFGHFAYIFTTIRCRGVNMLTSSKDYYWVKSLPSSPHVKSRVFSGIRSVLWIKARCALHGLLAINHLVALHVGMSKFEQT